MTRLAPPADGCFYVAPTGVDTVDGTDPQSPCRTRQYLYERMQVERDIIGTQITVHHADGPYLDSFTASGDLQGVTGGFGQVIFRGNLSNPRACIVRPSSGPAFSAQNGARLYIEGFAVDMTAAANDGIVITNESAVSLGKIVFGQNLYPFQDIQPGFRSVCNFHLDYEIDKPVVSTTGARQIGSNMIGLASPAGVVPYMGISGAGIPAGAYVSSIAGAWVTMGGGVSSLNLGNDPLTFRTGGNAHIQCDAWAQVAWGAVTVTATGNPFYFAGELLNDRSTFELGAATWAGITPRKVSFNGGIFSPA
jgi:hypothetical protein